MSVKFSSLQSQLRTAGCIGLLCAALFPSRAWTASPENTTFDPLTGMQTNSMFLSIKSKEVKPSRQISTKIPQSYVLGFAGSEIARLIKDIENPAAAITSSNASFAFQGSVFMLMGGPGQIGVQPPLESSPEFSQRDPFWIATVASGALLQLLRPITNPETSPHDYITLSTNIVGSITHNAVRRLELRRIYVQQGTELVKSLKLIMATAYIRAQPRSNAKLQHQDNAASGSGNAATELSTNTPPSVKLSGEQLEKLKPKMEQWESEHIILLKSLGSRHGVFNDTLRSELVARLQEMALTLSSPL